MVSGAGALYLATYFDWAFTYAVMASCIGIGILTALLIGEPTRHETSKALHSKSIKTWLQEAVIQPFADFMTRSWRHGR